MFQLTNDLKLHDAKQGTQNHGPQPKSDLLPICVNKVLLKHAGCAHLLSSVAALTLEQQR